jgi:hypothetical protein
MDYFGTLSSKTQPDAAPSPVSNVRPKQKATRPKANVPVPYHGCFYGMADGPGAPCVAREIFAWHGRVRIGIDHGGAAEHGWALRPVLSIRPQIW